AAEGVADRRGVLLRALRPALHDVLHEHRWLLLGHLGLAGLLAGPAPRKAWRPAPVLLRADDAPLRVPAAADWRGRRGLAAAAGRLAATLVRVLAERNLRRPFDRRREDAVARSAHCPASRVRGGDYAGQGARPPGASRLALADRGR